MTEALVELTDEAKVLAVKLKKSLREKDFVVPLLPDIARRVLALTEDPKSDAHKLAQLIQSDQSLAGHVMRIANSAAYSPSASLLSLQQAIARLGMRLISEIALAATVNGKLFNVPGFETHLSLVWRHALLSALWAKEIARSTRRNVEASFLCGLLHSIGRPVVLQASLEIAKRLQITIDRAEHLHIEAQLHSLFSATVIEHWGMPRLIHEAVAFIDNYQDAPQFSEQACAISAAAEFANHSLDPVKYSADALRQSAVLADLNLYPDDIEKLLGLMPRIHDQVESLRL